MRDTKKPATPVKLECSQVSWVPSSRASSVLVTVVASSS
jgi:hypothetical protein